MIKKGEGYEIPVESDEPRDEEEAREEDEATASEDTETMSEVVAAEDEEHWEEKGEDKTYEQALDHLRRLQAEFANYKKRTDRERLQTVSWAQRRLVENLLPVLDDFNRAVESLEGDDSAAAEGMALIWDKLYRVLTEAGLEPIETEGAVFDPDIHEAVMTQPVEAERAGTVVAELVPGFLFKGQLVRPARVQVGMESEST
jgi:molecular chaperone GrpE